MKHRGGSPNVKRDSILASADGETGRSAVHYGFLRWWCYWCSCFLPETWGVLSHLQHPRSRPFEWVRGSDPHNVGRAMARGSTGERRIKGFGPSGPKHWTGCEILLAWDPPFSSWDDCGTSREPPRFWLPKDEEVIARRDFAIGNASLACLEYWPSHRWDRRPPETHDMHSSSVRVRTCMRISWE